MRIELKTRFCAGRHVRIESKVMFYNTTYDKTTAAVVISCQVLRKSGNSVTLKQQLLNRTELYHLQQFLTETK